MAKRGRTKYRVVRAGNRRFGRVLIGLLWEVGSKKGRFLHASGSVLGVHTFHGFLTFFDVFLCFFDIFQIFLYILVINSIVISLIINYSFIIFIIAFNEIYCIFIVLKSVDFSRFRVGSFRGQKWLFGWVGPNRGLAKFESTRGRWASASKF